MNAPLSLITHLDVPQSALRHRFVREAWLVTRSLRASDENTGVIGTTNAYREPRCELYGWRKNIAWHIDGTGWIYFLPLRGGPSLVMAKPEYQLLASVGDVIRLHDYAPHATCDDAQVVALFVGPFDEPDDGRATATLGVGLSRLAAGDYCDAPRVSPGFRIPAPDEVFAMNSSDHAELMLLSDAIAQSRLIIYCAQCEKRAIKMDEHFPYQWDSCLCEDHLSKRAQVKPTRLLTEAQSHV